MKKLKRLFKKVMKIFKKAFLTGYYYFNFEHNKIKQNDVLFESRNGLDIAGNIFRLLQEICSGNYRTKNIYLSVCSDTISRAQKLLKRYNIENVKIVKQGSFRYWKLLASVKYIFTDTSLPRRYIKKDGQVFTNTWHGTPLKKMGKYSYFERHSMGNIQRCLLFSDYLIYPNDYMREKMLDSYNLESLYKGEILCEGYPRNSVFFKEQNTDLKKELGFENKELFVYMPTWKAENMGATMMASLDKLKGVLSEIDKLLSDSQVMLLKLHPLVSGSLCLSGFKHIKSFPNGVEPYEVLAFCDCLVTDYSSVFFDFAASRKKIVLFAPDEEDYNEQRGFFFELSELPFSKTKTPEQLVKALNEEKAYDDTEFIKKFCTYDNENAAKNILSHIINGEKCCKTYTTKKSNKKKVLLYCGALLQNGITAAFKNLLGLINLDDREYYFAVKQSAFSNYPERIDIIDDKIKLYSLSSGIDYTLFESISMILFYKLNVTAPFVKRVIDKIYKREFKKHFTDFDMDYVINFSGYDKYILKLLNEFDAKKTIFVHSDMEKEINDKGNQHKPTLSEVYRNSDYVAVVTEAMAGPVKRISGRKDNIVVVSNSFNDKSVVEKSKLPIEYQKNSRNSIHHPGGIEGILSSNATKFITVGRYSQEKQHTMLIDAFDEYYKENPDSFLIIIGGSGNLYAKTVRYANSKNSAQNIACLWSMANPMPIIEKCDLFVLCSKYEALGLVLFEADVLSVPCICTEMDGPKQIITKHNGTMVKNSKEGILEGFKAFEEGKVKAMNIDFDEYNKEALSQFEKLFN